MNSSKVSTGDFVDEKVPRTVNPAHLLGGIRPREVPTRTVSCESKPCQLPDRGSHRRNPFPALRCHWSQYCLWRWTLCRGKLEREEGRTIRRRRLASILADCSRGLFRDASEKSRAMTATQFSASSIMCFCPIRPRDPARSPVSPNRKHAREHTRSVLQSSRSKIPAAPIPPPTHMVTIP